MLTQQLSESPEPQGTVGVRRRAVECVIEEMSLRLDSPPSLLYMAARAGLSRFHFDRIFRDATGLPPKAFGSALRVSEAKRLLAVTTRSVTDVCFDLGYSSLGTFVARFTKLVGLSPARWRQALREIPSVAGILVGAPVSDNRSRRGTVAVDVHAPQDFRGVIFAGLFSKPSPHGLPVACTIAREPGTVTFRGVPDGLFYLCVAGVTHPLLYADADRMLRAGGARTPIVVRDGHFAGAPSVHLRPKEATDPPILVALPFIGFRPLTELCTHGEHLSLVIANPCDARHDDTDTFAR